MKKHLIRFLAISAVALFSSCNPLPPEPWVTVNIEPIAHQIADNDGVPLEVFDIKATISNTLSDQSIYISAIDSKFESNYLKSRNPGEISYWLEKKTESMWANTDAGYTGFPLTTKELAASQKMNFTIPIPLKITKGSGEYRIIIYIYLSAGAKTERKIYSNAIKI